MTAKVRHHQISLESTRLALGPIANAYADYFDRCRRKRNVIDYTHAHVATETEAQEMSQKATEFYERVEAWIASTQPTLKR